MLLLNLFRGRQIPVPPVEAAREFLAGEALPYEMLPAGRRLLTGSPARLRQAIESVAADYGAEEVFVVNTIRSAFAGRLPL